MLPQKARRRAQTRDWALRWRLLSPRGTIFFPFSFGQVVIGFARPWYGLGRLPIRCLASDLRVKFRATNRFGFVSNGVDQLRSLALAATAKVTALLARRWRGHIFEKAAPVAQHAGRWRCSSACGRAEHGPRHGHQEPAVKTSLRVSRMAKDLSLIHI